jgi:hypothetical protein
LRAQRRCTRTKWHKQCVEMNSWLFDLKRFKAIRMGRASMR